MAEDATKKTQAEQPKTLTDEELDKVDGGYIGQILVKYDAFKEADQTKVRMI